MNNKDINCGCSAVPGQTEQASTEPVVKHQTQATGGDSASLKKTVRDAGVRAREMSREAAQRVQEEGRQLADEKKEHLATKIAGGGEAVRGAAHKFREENDPNIARYAEMLADNFDRVGEYVRRQDLGAIYHDLERAARGRPEIFFGGMFVAGLAVARFLKASSQNRQNHDWRSNREGSSHHPEQSQGTESNWQENQEPIGTPKVSMANVPQPEHAH